MELRRPHLSEEGLVRLWAEKALDLCARIDDEEALAEYRDPVQEALHALSHDRRILTLGGARAGKSTLLSSLADEQAIANSPMEGHYTCWRFICRDGDATHSRFIPRPCLEGLELVDTADLERPEVRRTGEQLMQGADVVIGVLDARSPAASPVWDLLATVPPEARKAWLLVVAQVNRLDAREAIALKERLRQQSHIHGAQDLRILIFPGPQDANGVTALRTCVQNILEDSHGSSGSIRRLAELTMDLVQRADRVLSAREGVSRMYNVFMSGIEQEIDNFLHSQTIGLAGYCRGVQLTIRQTVPDLLEKVRCFLGRILSPSALLRLELLGGMTNNAFYDLMEHAILSMQEESDRHFVLQCAAHWQSVRPRMRKTLECEIGDFSAAVLEKELKTLRERLCRQLYEPLADAGLRARFLSLFVAQAGWMQACIVCICIFLVLAGILGSIGQNALAVGCVILALLTWLIVCGVFHFATRKICSQIESVTLDLCASCQKDFLSVLEGLIVSRVTAYRQLYIVPRRKIAKRELELKPLQEQQRTICTQLRILLPHL